MVFLTLDNWYPVSVMMKINSSLKIEMTVSIWIYFHSIYVVCQDMEGNFMFLKFTQNKIWYFILTEIGAKNISMMEHLIPGYTLHHIIPNKNKCGGVGIYFSECIDCVTVLDELSVKLTCGCCKCETASLFVECLFRGTYYIIGGIYRHPNGRVAHFVHDLENSLSKKSPDRRVVIAGDMNIDVIRISENEGTLLYVTTLLSYKYLPYITMPTRITSHSATCIDHIFVKNPTNDAIANTISGIFYCDITDHLPCFISISRDPRFRLN